MEGVFGAVGRFTRDDMKNLGAKLQHRGNHEALWSPATGVLLGLRADQCANVNPSRPRVPIVLAGSILNSPELALLVDPSGDLGKSYSDAELVWELYRTFGYEAFGRINGQFALGLLDPESNNLVLAVDNWASRPLYFAECERGFAFATEYAPLLALEDVPVRPNLAAIQILQSTKYLPLTGGLLSDIYPVGPGTCVRFINNSWSVERYSPLKLHVSGDRSTGEYAAELHDIILAATERLVAGQNTIGIALSAGLDSTLTVGAVRKVAPDTVIHTFTAAFRTDDPALKMAARTAEYFGTLHHEIIISPKDLSRLLFELVPLIEDPVGREEMVVYMALTREASKYVSKVLYGHLADILFAGMPRHLLVWAASEFKLFRQAIVDFYEYTQNGKTPESVLGKTLVRLYYHRGPTTPVKVAGLVTAEKAKELKLSSEEALNNVLLTSLAYPSEIGAIERLHARCGLDYGSIFHDLEVAKCAFRIPGRKKIRGRSRKYILRKAAEGILPGWATDRPKDLIRITRDAGMWAVMDALAEELLSPDAVARRGIFRQEEIDRLLVRPASGTCPDDQFYHIWTLLLTEIWARAFIDTSGGKVETQPGLLNAATLGDS